MEVKVTKKEAKEAVLEFDTLDTTIPDLLASALLKDKDVAFAGVERPHVETGHPSLVIKTNRKGAGEALERAIDSLNKELSAIKDSAK
ncbi:MAG: hypothetical protein M1562_00865 [Candidatus Marsarchaeota archaeon]|nr:hypothetical protein [Candidatus Marsarchaeota archaeon]